MALDPNIALQVRPFKMDSPINAMAQMYQLQGAQQANQLNAMQMAEYERARAEEEGVRNYLTGADIKAPETRSALATKFGKTGLGYAEALAKQEAAALEQKIKQIDYTTKVNDAAASIYGTVKDENSWQAAKPKLAALGGDPSKLPVNYDPNYVDQEKKTALKVKDQLTLLAPKPMQVKKADGSIVFLDQNANSPTFGKEVMPGQAAGMTPFQEESLKVSKGNLAVAQKRLEAESATGILSPESLDLAANMYINTGTLPPLGIGKGAANVKSQIMNRAAQLTMGEGGPNAADAAKGIIQNKVELAGTTAGQRTLGTTLANITTAATEASKMIPITQTYIAKVNPSDYPTVNAVGNYVAAKTGDPNIVGLATSLNSLVNAYARAINPKGAATVSDKNHAREIINTAMSSGQLNEALSVMQQEMNAAMAAPAEVKASMRGNKPAAPALSGVDQQALEWANANSNDPRAAQIKQRLGK